MATDLIDVPITDITQAEPVLADDIVKEVILIAHVMPR